MLSQRTVLKGHRKWLQREPCKLSTIDFKQGIDHIIHAMPSSVVLAGHMWRQAINTAETAPLDAMTGPKEFPTLLEEHQYHIQARAVIALLSEQGSL